MRAVHLSTAHIAAAFLAGGLALFVVSGIYAHHYARQLPATPPSRHARDAGDVQAWMTIHYVARTHDVPESALLTAVGIDQLQARRQSLAAIAGMQHKVPNTLVAEVRAAIVAYKAHPGATSPSPEAPRLPAPPQ